MCVMADSVKRWWWWWLEVRWSCSDRPAFWLASCMFMKLIYERLESPIQCYPSLMDTISTDGVL